jgi:hypothetical protein
MILLCRWCQPDGTAGSQKWARSTEVSADSFYSLGNLAGKKDLDRRNYLFLKCLQNSTPTRRSPCKAHSLFWQLTGNPAGTMGNMKIYSPQLLYGSPI